jgi:hypothetical protein
MWGGPLAIPAGIPDSYYWRSKDQEIHIMPALNACKGAITSGFPTNWQTLFTAAGQVRDHVATQFVLCIVAEEQHSPDYFGLQVRPTCDIQSSITYLVDTDGTVTVPLTCMADVNGQIKLQMITTKPISRYSYTCAFSYYAF